MQVKAVDGVQVVKMAARIDVTTAPQLEQLLNGLLESGQARIVCDFAENEYVSSVGLRVFLSALKRAAKAGGNLVLCALKPGILEIFDMTGLAGLFPICDSRDAALAFFRGEASPGSKRGGIEEIVIGKQPEDVTRAYSAQLKQGRMDEKA
jgi:anti-sigma B factor antagonist